MKLGTISAWNPFAYFLKPAPTAVQIKNHDLQIELSVCKTELTICRLRELELVHRIEGISAQLDYIRGTTK